MSARAAAFKAVYPLLGSAVGVPVWSTLQELLSSQFWSRERLEALPALDVVMIPVAMKKNRPGQKIEVLVEPALAARAEEILLRDSSTFGLRRTTTERVILEREIVSVETPYGPAKLKIGRRGGEAWRS